MEFPSELKSMLFVLALVRIIGYLDLTNPKYFVYVVSIYAASQCLLFLMCYFIHRRIRHANDRSIVSGIEIQKPFQEEAEKTIEMPVHEYDADELAKIVKGNIVAIAILGFVYWKFEVIQPFILQTIMPWKSLISNPLVKIHLFGRSPEGDLSRPFVKHNKSLLAEWLKQEPEPNPLPPSRDDNDKKNN